ncbi:MAG: RNA polymerase sigma factor [Clostridia bacterium]|jgi:RNA polymerase sigma-70 factor (ECF subfamily)
MNICILITFSRRTAKDIQGSMSFFMEFVNGQEGCKGIWLWISCGLSCTMEAREALLQKSSKKMELFVGIHCLINREPLMGVEMLTRDLIARIIDHDVEAFRILYDMYKERVFRTAWSILKNEHMAQDVTQETFIQVFYKMDQLKSYDYFEGWLFRIAINLCMTYIRKNSRYKLAWDEELVQKIEEKNTSILPEDYYFSKELQREVMEMVYELPIKQRIPIILYYYNDMSIRDIATAMNTSEGTIKSRLSRSKQALRKKLTRKYRKEGYGYGLG